MEVWSTAAGSSFCPRCGALLSLHDSGSVACDTCAYSARIQDLPQLRVVTQSYSKPLPEWLVEYQASIRTDGGAKLTAGRKERATVNEECPKCKNPIMEYYTMQLRSADEGQTVFYECPKCSHKYSINT